MVYIIKTMININDIWKTTLDELSKLMQVVTFEVWIEKLEPVCVYDNKLVLSAPTVIAKRTIENKHQDTIDEVLVAVHPQLSGTIIINEDQKEEYLSMQESVIEGGGFVINDKPAQSIKNPFNEKYTFDTFVKGKSNEMAFEAAKTVAQNLGTKFNPLFIYAGVGLGKTHLLNAIGNFIIKTQPKTKIVYVNSETMINDIINNIRSSSNEEQNAFRDKYRNCDVLMVDDIQFLSGKTSTQEVFFHIFNDLYQQDKQIILTSDKAPNEIPTLEERLRTRFASGLTLDIQIPDLETRVSILRSKALQEKFNLSDDVAFYIAENATTNVREMEGLLKKIVFYSSLTNHIIDTRELAQEALKDSLSDKKGTIDAIDIVETVAKYYKLSAQDLFGQRRTKNIVEPRMIAIYLINELLSMPLAAIGDMFGGRDHSTIIHARNKITDDIREDKRIKIVVADLKNMLLNR